MLHKKIALTFTLFSSLSLVLNVFTPDNPSHTLNVIELSVLCAIFTLSYFAKMPAAGALQVVSLIAASLIPMGVEGSLFFGAVVAVFALVLIYGYGGYRSSPAWKLPATFAFLFILCSIASSHFTPPSLQMVLQAFGWTVFIGIFCFVMWLVIADMEHRFHADFASDLIKQNRELLEINKKLMAGGCDDANNT